MMKQRLLAEAIGTFFLVFAGTGAIVVNETMGGIVTHVGVAVTFGLIVMAVIYAVGDVSGAHINPAVSIGFLIAGRLPMADTFLYVVAQMIGALAASGVIALLFPGHHSFGATLPQGSWQQAFGMELVITFLLMFIIISVAVGAKEKGLMAGAAIGATVALAALFAGPVSGASMNPARSIAPALFAGTLTDQWIYIVAPIIGAAVAIAAYRGVYGRSDDIALNNGGSA